MGDITGWHTYCTRKRYRTVRKTLATFRTLAATGALALAVVAAPAPAIAVG